MELLTTDDAINAEALPFLGLRPMRAFMTWEASQKLKLSYGTFTSNDLETRFTPFIIYESKNSYEIAAPGHP